MDKDKVAEKAIEAVGDVVKVAANLSEAKRAPDTQNQDTKTGNQSVQIHMETGKKREPRPVEKHIHEFPEARPLTEQECELALKKAQMKYDLDKAFQQHAMAVDQREWEHKMEVEKKREKKQKVRRVVGCIMAALGIGYLGYNIYTNRNNPAPSVGTPNAPTETAGDNK